jgi:hypothetical protein
VDALPEIDCSPPQVRLVIPIAGENQLGLRIELRQGLDQHVEPFLRVKARGAADDEGLSVDPQLITCRDTANAAT